MKRAELFLVIIALGSLWGFFEMLALPVWLLSIIGFIFLVLARKKVNIPGSSILIGLIVCIYKTYSDNFFICQWAGVMALAGSFELYSSLVFKRNWQRPHLSTVIGLLTNITALIVFVSLVIFVFEEPNWVSGGFERILSYALRNTLPASLLSSLVGAALAYFSTTWISEINSAKAEKLMPGIYLATTLVLWIMASFN